ncbi:nucleoside-diphosphate-sugar epimerase [Pseudoduganella lurida]|uniref:Nucleoside-diphosphate-sugar epimerase n=1 Tax=Pseudoduganella lurida TaxID=1036180 RepID=A0A562QV38_9BURK|nr:NAD(P)-dependent oxidoreductase [Pseudoduganella lurida]TWI60649.1 nucleoside-diphosphate-sugar epimerase [Pseudoduganella lurida]
MSGPTALLTGATGFIGAALTRRLLADGWQVHVVLRPASSRAALPADGALHVHVHDGSSAGLRAIVGAARPDVVFHLASLFLAQHGPDDTERLIESNVLFSTQLAEAMVAAGAHRLLNTGTSWQHYQDGDYDPVCLYAATKQAFEAILRYYTTCTPLRSVTLKLFDTYGPGDPRPKLMHLLQKTAHSGAHLAMSPGEQLIDLVYIDDVVDAFVAAAGRLLSGAGAASEAFGVSSGRPLPLRELAATFARVSGLPLDIEWGGRPYRPREVMQPWTRYSTLPGWQPRVTLEDGLARLLGST